MASPDAFGGATPWQLDDDGSFRMVIVVLALMAAITAASVAIGQLFVGRRGLRRTGYDMEDFVVRRCGACVGIVETVQVIPPVKDEKEVCVVEPGDGAEAEIAEELDAPSEAPKEDDEESGSIQAYPYFLGMGRTGTQ